MAETTPPKPPAPPAVMQAAPWEGELPEQVQATFPNVPLSFQTYLGQNFILAERGHVPALVSYLKDAVGFDFLVDLTAVDYPKDPARFELVYILYSFSRNERVRIKTHLQESQSALSIVSFFAGANWLEREAFDMFGIPFEGHPGLTRILMPEDWHGYPLRKDASIIGIDQDWVKRNLGIESGQ